jgi:hypothetical protein
MDRHLIGKDIDLVVDKELHPTLTSLLILDLSRGVNEE